MQDASKPIQRSHMMIRRRADAAFVHTSIALAFAATLMFSAGAVAQQPAPPASSPYNSPAGVWPPYGSPGGTPGQAQKLAQAAQARAPQNGGKEASAARSRPSR